MNKRQIKKFFKNNPDMKREWFPKRFSYESGRRLAKEILQDCIDAIETREMWYQLG